MSLWLQLRMWLVTAVLFGILYAVISVVSYLFGIQNFLFYGLLAFGIMLLQYLAGPKIVEWTMGVKYVSEKEEPELHRMVEELSKEAKIPKPKVGISSLQIPNAFAFGRWKSDGRVCVTEGILKILDKKELRAVLGHEVSHLRNHDVVFITLLSAIPLILWFVARGTLFSGGQGENRGGAALIGIAAFVFYFITNLLVLYASRIREYYADRGSIGLGNKPHELASALFKLVKSSAKAPLHAVRQAEGMKAFFANDISKARFEIKEVSHLDLDRSGHIDAQELAEFRSKEIKLSAVDHLMELLTTHPNMLKRIKALSEMK